MSITDASAALVEARQAILGGDETRALDKVIDGWRVSRSAEIARVAESLSKRLEPHLTPIGGKPDDFQPLWLAIAKRKRAVDLPRLLGSVMHGTDRFGVAVVNALMDRGKALAAWPADPRASTIIVEHLVRGGYESTSKSTYPFWSVMFDMLETHADPRVFDRLSKIRYAKIFRTFSDGARRIVWFQEQLDGVIERLAATQTTALTRAVDERVTKLATLIAARGPVQPGEVARITHQPRLPAKKVKQRGAPPKLDVNTARAQVEATLRALQAGDDGAALRALLEAWRSTRASRIAELVERVSRRCEGQLPRIAAANRAATQTAWVAVARDQRAEDLPRLLASITQTFGRSTDALARVKALASWPSDPRTYSGAIRQLEAPYFYTSSTKPFWSALIGLVVDHHDPRAAIALDELASRYHRVLVSKYADLTSTVSWFKRQLTDGANQLRDRVPAPIALDSGTGKACDAIAALLATEEELLAEIYANPDDDQPREVYADLLQQRNDPRGELIALQLTNREPARVAELVRTHAHAWLAPILPVLYLDECQFERGFLSRVTLGDISARLLDTVVGHPLWSTVTELDCGVFEKPPKKFLAHPSMKRVRISGAGSPRRRRR